MSDQGSPTKVMHVGRQSLQSDIGTSLVCLDGAAFGESFIVYDSPVTLGRDRDADVSLDDLAASRRHAQVVPHDDGHAIVDLQSSNGTFLNGERIDQKVPLKDGDIIGIGTHLFKVLRRNAVEIAYHKRMARLSMIDELTGCLNRRAIMDAINRNVSMSMQESLPLAIIVLDIDHFKTINDTRGHGVGDQVLKELVSRITLTLRPTDKVGRIGGEEFLVLVPRSPRRIIEKIAERLRTTVAGKTFLEDNQPIPVTISIGFSMLDAALGKVESTKPADVIETMMALADEKLYEAKRAGRNCIRF